MPIPEKQPNESTEQFIGRCMNDEKMNNEYPDYQQRYAVCVNQLGWKLKK